MNPRGWGPRSCNARGTGPQPWWPWTSRGHHFCKMASQAGGGEAKASESEGEGRESFAAPALWCVVSPPSQPPDSVTRMKVFELMAIEKKRKLFGFTRHLNAGCTRLWILALWTLFEPLP